MWWSAALAFAHPAVDAITDDPARRAKAVAALVASGVLPAAAAPNVPSRTALDPVLEPARRTTGHPPVPGPWTCAVEGARGTDVVVRCSVDHCVRACMHETLEVTVIAGRVDTTDRSVVDDGACGCCEIVE